MKKIVITSVLIILIASTAGAQMYQKHFGVRMGATTGFSAKVIKSENFALEGIIGIRNGGMQVYGLFENYNNAFRTRIDNMWFYFGGGFHFGFANYYTYQTQSYYSRPPFYNYRMTSVLGVDGIFGLEYHFPMSPVVIGIDFKPFVEVVGFHSVEFNFWDIGFHVAFNL